eukprot:UN29756
MVCVKEGSKLELRTSDCTATGELDEKNVAEIPNDLNFFCDEAGQVKDVIINPLLSEISSNADARSAINYNSVPETSGCQAQCQFSKSSSFQNTLKDDHKKTEVLEYTAHIQNQANAESSYKYWSGKYGCDTENIHDGRPICYDNLGESCSSRDDGTKFNDLAGQLIDVRTNTGKD